MFSSTVMDHFQNPRNVGSLEGQISQGTAGSLETGRYVQFYLRLEGERITAARFKAYGCVPAIAAGSVLAHWAEGLTVDEARGITTEQLLERLGGLPPQRRFCAALAVEALRNALADTGGPRAA